MGIRYSLYGRLVTPYKTIREISKRSRLFRSNEDHNYKKALNREINAHSEHRSPAAYDVVIIGAGVVGLTIAYELSRFDLSIAVIDENLEPGFGVSKGHAGLVHVVQMPFGSLKSSLAIMGNKFYDRLVRELGIGFRRVSALLVANRRFQLLELPIAYIILKLLYESRGFKVSVVRGAKLLNEEPNVVGYAAIRIEGYGIVDSFNLVYRLYEACSERGVIFYLGTKVLKIDVGDDLISITTSRGEILASYVVNSAGLYSDYVASLTGSKDMVIPRKGVMIVFDKPQTRNVIAPLEILKPRGTKGGGIIPTLWGHTIWGPNLSAGGSKSDRSVEDKDLVELYKRFGNLVRVRGTPIKAYAGIRPASPTGDFKMEYSPKSRRIINLVGIESPGLTAAPALAFLVISMLRKAGLRLRYRSTTIPSPPRASTRTRLIKRPWEIKGDEGVIVCPCMAVSLADIADAVRRGARTLDGVMFRTKLGMGTCQGQNCLARAIVEISRLLGVRPGDLVKSGEGSWLVE